MTIEQFLIDTGYDINMYGRPIHHVDILVKKNDLNSRRTLRLQCNTVGVYHDAVMLIMENAGGSIPVKVTMGRGRVIGIMKI